MSTDWGFWFLQVPGWALVAYLVVAQCVSALNYRMGVRMGTQEPAERITEVGVAFWWGLAFADLVFYTPILALGLMGHNLNAYWADVALGAALGITIYWPIASLATVYKARGAPGWSLPRERDYWTVLPLIAVWAFAGLTVLILG